MAAAARGGRLLSPHFSGYHHRRHKTTSAAHVAARHIDHTFEKHMEVYKRYLRVVTVEDLILASPSRSVTVPFLSSLSQKLRLNRGAPYFLRKCPHVFSVFYDMSASQPSVALTPAANAIANEESAATSAGASLAVERLVKILSMSQTRMVPFRAVFKVWRELGLPNDFEDSIIARNPRVFQVRDNPRERNTHLLQLVDSGSKYNFTPAVEKWRVGETESRDSSREQVDVRFAFKQGFPPGMKLKKNFRKKVKEWQQLPYVGPYEAFDGGDIKRTRAGMMGLEKRAVGIAHEFLSLTVEKTVEVEQISHFRKWFGVDLNVRDLFLDHPGIFYLSTKGKRHTVFLREAYDRGRLVESNPVYDARRKLLHLVSLGRRGMVEADGGRRQGKSLEDLEDALEEACAIISCRQRIHLNNPSACRKL